MARRRRFNKLLGGLEYLRPIGGGVSPEAPTGTALRNFQEYRAGRVNRTFTRSATSYPGVKTEYRMELFSLATTNDTVDYFVGQRARDGIGQIQGLSLQILGLTATTQGMDPPQYSGRFSPAKVSCFRREGTGGGSPRRSQITGISHRTINGNTFSYPFGKVAEADRYRDRAAVIDAAAKTVMAYEDNLVKLFQVKTSLAIVLEGFLERVVATGHSSIDPQLLKGFLATAIAEGQLDNQPSFKTVEEEMFSLGWKRAKKSLGNWHWVKA